MPPSAARPERYSPRFLARIYASIGLSGIATGYFDIEHVRNHIVMNGDVAIILHHLRVCGPLFRFGIPLHRLMVFLNGGAELIAYDRLRRGNPLVAIMALGCALAGAPLKSWICSDRWSRCRLPAATRLQLSAHFKRTF